ncbi:hypothetical protein SAMN04488003_101323 [Loktanella fryxellensis]|uniref:DNA repair protein n=1 Tax=Loktanella fryxellensis TaxID=245187 RepID=A0A1H7YUU1_9RHOB|nr:DNA repair protein [Loktanella fryxellensis]SEM49870.1 hypothetical protein SAMN04488003_101323 [Loktanella fryxellensis]
MTLSGRDVMRVLHTTSLIFVAAAGIAAVAYTALCLAGVVPWLQIAGTFGNVPAGPVVQGALTALLVGMMTFLPTAARMLALETSHRNFHINMDDVARAYASVHAADRAGVFTLSSEFDAVRERLAYLRDHPDLPGLENGVMEVAAQMSVQSRHLAEVYSNDRIARAKAFLRQRQEAAEDQQARIVDARHICEQIRTWSDQVEIEEARVASQLAYLDGKLQSTLPLLGYALEHDEMLDAAVIANQRTANGTNIVPLTQKPGAE